MKRAAILSIPREWFTQVPNFVFHPNELGLHGQCLLLRQFGCSEFALQWLHSWQYDFNTACMRYRFESDEGETTMPFCAAGYSPGWVNSVYELNKYCSKRRASALQVLGSPAQEEKWCMADKITPFVFQKKRAHSRIIER